MKQLQTWLPWTGASVWKALTDLQALAGWTPLHLCGKVSNGLLVPGIVLQWKTTGQLGSSWLSLTVEHLRPSHSIDCSFSTRRYRGHLAIQLVPVEGNEATVLATLVTVEQVVPRSCSWMLAPLVRTLIALRIKHAFRRLDALLEERQEQAEQGLNAVYTCWQQVQAERERFHRQLLAQSLHYRRW